MSFENLELIQPLRKALASEGYTTPTPIQKAAIPAILEGRDILGCAQTGTGKTAAFAVPILQLLHTPDAYKNPSKQIHALILTPTRELALQIGESFSNYGRLTGLRNVVVFGGVSQKPQTDALRKGVDILIATPGRLLDLIDQKFIDLKQLKIFVLDEADRMLDMGFIHDIKKVMKLIPVRRQTLLFSATVPTEIKQLAGSLLNNPVRIEITPDSPTVDAIAQGLYHVEKNKKKSLLLHVLKESSAESVLVFTRTKHGADNVTRFLNKAGISAESIHSNKAQNARQRALNSFKAKETRVLVATDIAARGLDIEELAMVINFEIPNIPESYIHRIGRTGRAGLNGIALSFCDETERAYVKDISKTINKTIPLMVTPPLAETPKAERKDTPRPVKKTAAPKPVAKKTETPVQEKKKHEAHPSRQPHKPAKPEVKNKPVQQDSKPQNNQPSRPPEQQKSRGENRFRKPQPGKPVRHEKREENGSKSYNDNRTTFEVAANNRQNGNDLRKFGADGKPIAAKQNNQGQGRRDGTGRPATDKRRNDQRGPENRNDKNRGKRTDRKSRPVPKHFSERKHDRKKDGEQMQYAGSSEFLSDFPMRKAEPKKKKWYERLGIKRKNDR